MLDLEGGRDVAVAQPEQLAGEHRVVAAVVDPPGAEHRVLHRPDGRVLVFEANVGMKILFNQFQSPSVWDAPIARIEAALVALLRDPTRWTAGRAAP